MQAADEWRLTVSSGKTNGLVVGKCREGSDVEEVPLEAGSVEMVEMFTYMYL